MGKVYGIVFLLIAMVGVAAAIFMKSLPVPVCHGEERAPEFYRQEMASLVRDLHQYARERRTGFGLLPNGGVAIYLPEDDGMEYDLAGLLDSMDGVLVESVFYGADMVDNGETAEETTRYFQRALAVPKSHGLPVFNIDYCSDKDIQKDSLKKNAMVDYVDFTAPRRELDVIPSGTPPNENAMDCTSLKDAKNFLVLLNPSRYRTRENFLRNLQGTDYDLLIIDLYFGDAPWTEEEVESLRRKRNGGRRLVYAYMSIGEAENYRKYWKPRWNEERPDWLAESNEAWEGSYKVRYWRQEWKNLLYGSPDAYLDRILAAGFDGAFLDVMDTFYYFEEGAKEKQ